MSVKMDLLNQKLTELNSDLENKVEDRTSDLEILNRDLEKINRDLLLMQKSHRRLMSNVSHDLRTPMTTIQGYVEAILDGVVKEGEHRKYLELIYNKALAVNRMTQELFELSQLESRQVNMNFLRIPTLKLIGNVYEKYKLDVEASGLVLGLQLPAGAGINSAGVPECEDSGQVSLPVIEVDTDRMDRVFANLLFNAVKHTPPGGGIIISCGIIPEGEVRICVSDSGSGISEEDLPYVFDRFYRGSKSRISSRESSSLGLSIARETVEIHGGRIWAESAPGRGSTFCFTLPAR